MNATVLFCVTGDWVGSQTIPLHNADKYNISISSITEFGGSGFADATGWTIHRHKIGFSLEENNSYWADFFGNQHPGKLFVVTFTCRLA